jgi:adenylate cyclase
MGHWLAGRYEEGLAWAQKSMRQQPEWLTAYRASIHCLVALGRLEEAQQISQRLLKLRPDTRISTERDYLTYRDPAVEARILDGLRLAGIPE